MGLGELLDQIRSFYLDRFQEVIAEKRTATGTEIVVESPYFDSSGEPRREGAFNLPMRGDVFVIEEGKVIEALQVDTDNMLGFSPMTFEWQSVVQVTLNPFQWNWCPVAIYPTKRAEELVPISKWFTRWFESSASETEEFSGAVHFLSDPETTGESVLVNIDLGSAPLDAFEELLDSCVEIGATSVSIGAS